MGQTGAGRSQENTLQSVSVLVPPLSVCGVVGGRLLTEDSGRKPLYQGQSLGKNWDLWTSIRLGMCRGR